MPPMLQNLVWGALALAPYAFADSTRSLIFCTTLLGPKSVNSVPTKTYALTFTSKVVASFTSTPVTTITPPAETVTISDTATETSTTTASQNTDTFYSTITSTVTDTTTTTEDVTATSTSTLSITITSTVTIQPSNGFTPAASATANGAPAKRTPRARLAQRAPKPSSKVTMGSDGRPILSPVRYPQSVLCGGVVEVISTTTKTYTATATATVTGSPPPASSTTTTVSTTTTTTVVLPDASTTVTSTSTSTSTITNTETSTVATTTTTQTQTVNAPTATYYAACAPNNLVTTINGVNLNGFGYSNAISQVTTNSAYDCCVSCLTSSTCGAAFFYSTGRICFEVAYTGTCNPSTLILDYFGSSSSPPNIGFASSSNCGVAGFQAT